MLFKLVGLTPVMERSSLSSSVSNPAVKASPQLRHIAGGGDATTKTQTQLLQLPPLLDLPLVREDEITFYWE